MADTRTALSYAKRVVLLAVPTSLIYATNCGARFRVEIWLTSRAFFEKAWFCKDMATTQLGGLLEISGTALWEARSYLGSTSCYTDTLMLVVMAHGIAAAILRQRF